MKVVPVVIDPYDPATSLLIPLVTQQIIRFAEEHVPEVSPRETARVFMSRLMVADPNIKVCAFVADGGKCVGHAIATIECLDSLTTLAHIWQVHVDPSVNSEDAVPRALDLLIEWAREYSEKVLLPQGRPPISKVKMETSRDDRAYVRKYGFEKLRHIMIRSI